MVVYSFLEYIRLVLGVEELYRLQDPLGAATINVFHPQTRSLHLNSDLVQRSIVTLIQSYRLHLNCNIMVNIYSFHYCRDRDRHLEKVRERER